MRFHRSQSTEILYIKRSIQDGPARVSFSKQYITSAVGQKSCEVPFREPRINVLLGNHVACVLNPEGLRLKQIFRQMHLLFIGEWTKTKQSPPVKIACAPH